MRMLQIIFVFMFLFLFLMVSHLGGINFLYASNGAEGCQNQSHPTWTPQEQWVWTKLCEGEIADFNQLYGRLERLDPRGPEGWQENRKLRTEEFLEVILLNERYWSMLPPDGVRIIGGWFVEPLDLSHAVLMHQLQLDYSRFECDDRVAAEFDSCVDLSGLQTSHQISFAGSKFESSKPIGLLLVNAEIGDHLNMTGSKVTGFLNMNGLQVEKSLLMRGDAEFNEVELVGAIIRGQLSMIDSKVTGFLNMDSLQVDGHLLMRGDAEFNEVDLRGATIGGQLDMRGSKFTDFLNMNNLQVENILLMRDAEFVNNVSLRFSDLNGNLDLSLSTFASFDLTGTHIRGELALDGTSWSRGAQLILADTDVGILHYTEEAWPEKLDLNGFTYASLKNRAADDRDPFDVCWFKRWLERQEHYSPQPYEQLASVLLKQGYENKSRDILFASRKREHFESADWLRKILWLPLLFLFTGYGYRMEHAF
jgi:hypothetical protein